MTMLRTLSKAMMAFTLAVAVPPVLGQYLPQTPTGVGSTNGPAATSVRPVLPLYRHFFLLVAHMERDKAKTQSQPGVNVAEIERKLQNKVGLSDSEWAVVVATSNSVNEYFSSMSSQAHSIAAADRSLRAQGNLSNTAPPPGLAQLRAMQHTLDQKTRKDIDSLHATLGAEASARLDQFVKNTIGGSSHFIPLTHDQIAARMASKGGK